MENGEIHRKIHRKIKLIGNSKRFKILCLTQDKEMKIKDIYKEINLAYDKCREYINKLNKEGLVSKRKEGKFTYVKSNVIIKKDKIEFKI
jgi:predicted transcriptional regulator